MNREQHLRQFQISVQRLRLRYSKPRPLSRNILFSVSRGGWAEGGGNHIQKENGGKNARPFRRFRSLNSDARVNITVATAKTFVLTAKNYFYMVKVKRKMYFHLRKRCPSHEKKSVRSRF